MLPITRAQLVTQVRRLADIETDGYHITDDEIGDYLNDALKAMWAMVVNKASSLVAKVSNSLVNLGDNAYQLPHDFLRLVSVDIRKGAETWIHSIEADPQRYAPLSSVSSSSRGFSQHYLHLNVFQGRYELFIFPGVDTNDIFVRYVPIAPQLYLTTDELKVPDDWYRWAVYDAAIRCNIKEETDPSPLMIERERLEQRLLLDVAAHSPAQVDTIRDVSEWETQGGFFLPPINPND